MKFQISFKEARMGVKFGEISNEIFEIIGKEDYEELLLSLDEKIKEINFE